MYYISYAFISLNSVRSIDLCILYHILKAQYPERCFHLSVGSCLAVNNADCCVFPGADWAYLKENEQTDFSRALQLV